MRYCLCRKFYFRKSNVACSYIKGWKRDTLQLFYFEKTLWILGCFAGSFTLKSQKNENQNEAGCREVCFNLKANRKHSPPSLVNLIVFSTLIPVVIYASLRPLLCHRYAHFLETYQLLPTVSVLPTPSGQWDDLSLYLLFLEENISELKSYKYIKVWMYAIHNPKYYYYIKSPLCFHSVQ